MEECFKILIHKCSGSLHLKLMGDFDKFSALELISFIEKNAVNVNRVFIHTSGLRHVQSFGKELVRKYLASIAQKPFSIIFTGDAGCEIAPQGARMMHA